MKKKVKKFVMHLWNPKMGYLTIRYRYYCNFFPATYSAQAHYGLSYLSLLLLWYMAVTTVVIAVLSSYILTISYNLGIVYLFLIEILTKLINHTNKETDVAAIHPGNLWQCFYLYLWCSITSD
jgi:hypothetical protein